MTALAVIIAAALLLAFAGAVYQWVGERSDTKRYPAPGRLLRSTHVQEAGRGQPAVILEAGIAASSLSWTRVHPGIAEFTHVLSYDRAGLGWSDPSLSARTLDNIVDDLRALAGAAEVPLKYVLVGHSFGGLIVSSYASRYPHEVGGLVLVDPVAPSEWIDANSRQLAMLRRGVSLSRRGALLAKLGVVRFSLAVLMAGGRLLPKAVARVSSGAGAGVTERLVGEVRKLPPEVWPMVRSHWCRPGCFEAMAGYLESLPSCAAAAVLAIVPPEIPVTVLSAAGSTAARLREHEEIARRSARGRHVLAAKSGHWILLDEPDLVISAIRELVEYNRAQEQS